MSADLQLALSLADDADAVSLPRFRARDLRVETKADLTPVTDADRAVERALRTRLARERPDDGVLGEEEGGSGRAVRWIVDPIDGTKNFARGVPVWATLIALERDGVVVCGVASAPALGQRWWAARSEGAYRDGERIHASSTGRLESAAVSCSYARDLARFEPHVLHARGFGDFWQHMLVAEGALDAAVDAVLAPWDVAALDVIVHEAGGRVGESEGQTVTSNGLLHDDVLAALRSDG